MKFFKNWNLKKHIAVVVSFYAALLTVANGIMLCRNCRKTEKEIRQGGTWMKYLSEEEKAKAIAKSYVQEPTKTWKTVHCVLGACFLTDLAAYPLIKKLTKKL